MNSINNRTKYPKKINRIRKALRSVFAAVLALVLVISLIAIGGWRNVNLPNALSKIYASETITPTTHDLDDFQAGTSSNLNTAASPIGLNSTSGTYPALPSGYTYLRRVPIVNNSATDTIASGYQVAVTFNHASMVSAGKSLASGNDLRVYYDNGGSWVELDRWAEVTWNQSNTKVWFKTQAVIAASATGTSYYLAYGNPAAGAPPADGDSIFEFFDDFTGTTIDAAKWNETDTGSNITQNNELIIDGGIKSWTTTGIYSTSNFARSDLVVQAKYKTTLAVGISENSALFFKDDTAGINLNNFIYAINPCSGSRNRLFIYEGGLLRSSIAYFNENTQYWFRQVLKSAAGATTQTSRDGNDWLTVYDSTYSSETPLRVGLTHYDGGVVTIDDFIVRKYISSEPTAYTASEGTGGAETYYLQPATLESSAIDTGVVNARIQSLSWQTQGAGLTSQPSDTAIKFQVASSTDGSSWSSYLGPTGTTASYFTTAAGHNAQFKLGGRYFKYKAYFTTNDAANSPSLYSLTINYLKSVSNIETTTRISTDSAGIEGDNTSGRYGNYVSTSISTDGRYVAFNSIATNLVAGDTNDQEDVFRKDTSSGATIRVSTDSSEQQATGGQSNQPSISSDGRYIAFASDATNLVAGDTNAKKDVFRKDLNDGSVLRVSTDSDGIESNGVSKLADISSDGRYIVFQSDATNLVSGDINAKRDIFRKDVQTGETIRVSTGPVGEQANDDSGDTGNTYPTSISNDGRYVAFRSDATNLVSGDTSYWDGYVKDLQTGDITKISSDSAGTQANGDTNHVRISGNGRYVAFESRGSNLVSNDINGSSNDIFRKDLQTGETQLVSVDGNGYSSNEQGYDPAISDDGRYVAFESRAIDFPEEGSAADVLDRFYESFVRDMQAGRTIKVSTDSHGNAGTGDSYPPEISGDGRFVAYDSDATNLVTDDTNGKRDIYLATIDTTNPSAPSISSATHSSNSSYYNSINPSFSLSATDTNGIGGYSYVLDQSSSTTPDTASEGSSASISYSSIADGVWYFHARAQDNWGNWSNATHFQLNLEATAPLISAMESSGLTDGSWQNSISDPTFSITATDSGGSNLKEYYYYFGRNSGATPDILSTSSSIRPVAYTGATYYFRAKAKDNAGNESAVSSFTFKYDDEVPSLNIGALSSSKYYKGKIRFSASSNDKPSGIQNLYFYRNGKLIRSTASSSIVFDWNSKRYGGTQTIKVKAVDKAGNTSTSSKKIKIDNYKPRTYARLRKNSVRKGKLIRLYWKVRDPYTGNRAYVKIRVQKRVYSRSRAARKARYLRLYRVNIAKYRASKNRVYLRRAKKYLRAYRRTSVYFYKTVKLAHYGWTTINKPRAYRYKTGSSGKYRFLVYAKDRAGNSQARVAADYFRVR